jgi:TetR/AcrR family transcriptional regulator, mexJK operon transcriptional repressor
LGGNWAGAKVDSLTIYCQVRLVTKSAPPGPTRRAVTREAILAAGLRCFSRDGFRRTALDRVAREAGISRAALYLHFANKEDLFRALVASVHAGALAAATAAAHRPGDLAFRLTATLVAKGGRFFDLLRASEHAEEFLDENHRLCGALSAEAATKHTRLLAGLFTAADAAGEIALAPAGLTASQAAELLLDTAEGIKTRGRTTLSSQAYQQRLARAVRLVVAGLTPARAPRRHARSQRARMPRVR